MRSTSQEKLSVECSYVNLNTQHSIFNFQGMNNWEISIFKERRCTSFWCEFDLQILSDFPDWFTLVNSIFIAYLGMWPTAPCYLKNTDYERKKLRPWRKTSKIFISSYGSSWGATRNKGSQLYCCPSSSLRLSCMAKHKVRSQEMTSFIKWRLDSRNWKKHEFVLR